MDNQSVWYPYLSAVYNGDVLLPFDLSTLRHVYHNNAEWQSRHPGVWWPTCMPACEVTDVNYWSNSSAFSLRESPPNLPSCPRHECKRWEHGATSSDRNPRASSSNGSALDDEGCHGPCHVDIYLSSSVVHRSGALASGAQSAAVRWTRSLDLAVAREPFGRSLCLRPETALHLEHTGMWIEVARKRLGGELAAGAGIWFAVARGAGIWVQARKHWPNGADHGWPRAYERCM